MNGRAQPGQSAMPSAPPVAIRGRRGERIDPAGTGQLGAGRAARLLERRRRRPRDEPPGPGADRVDGERRGDRLDDRDQERGHGGILLCYQNRGGKAARVAAAATAACITILPPVPTGVTEYVYGGAAGSTTR